MSLPLGPVCDSGKANLSRFAYSLLASALHFTFIIPSYNGASKLPTTLDTLFAFQTDPAFLEALVVVDGSTDPTMAVLNGYSTLPLHTVVQQNQGRSSARNTGIAAAKGTHFFFLDDDIRVSDSCLTLHFQHHRDFPNSILVGNVLMDPTRLKKDFEVYLAHLFEKWNKNRPTKTQVFPSDFIFTTQNVSMPREVTEAIGNFDIRLTDAEDYDFGMRALEMEIPIYYDPAALAWHDDFPTCVRYIKRQAEYKRAHVRLKELGKKYLVDHFVPLTAPKATWKLLLLRMFSHALWVKGIDNQAFRFLPRKIRFKLYAVIVYSHTLKELGLI